MNVIGWAVIIFVALYIGYMVGEMDTENKHRKDKDDAN